MKSQLKMGLAATAVFLAVANLGSAGSPLTLPPVGPDRTATDTREGLLVVFSALDSGILATHLADHSCPHTGYALQLADGTPLRTVGNRSGAFGGEPEGVLLPAGSYRVIARADGYGRVIVPVTVAAGEMTTVHLESGNQGAFSFGPGVDQVRLPDGRVVGWRAAPGK
jgi:hypothetical protein